MFAITVDQKHFLYSVASACLGTKTLVSSSVSCGSRASFGTGP